MKYIIPIVILILVTINMQAKAEFKEMIITSGNLAYSLRDTATLAEKTHAVGYILGVYDLAKELNQICPEEPSSNKVYQAVKTKIKTLVLNSKYSASSIVLEILTAKYKC